MEVPKVIHIVEYGGTQGQVEYELESGERFAMHELRHDEHGAPFLGRLTEKWRYYFPQRAEEYDAYWKSQGY
jgi:hypothetical protein